MSKALEEQIKQTLYSFFDFLTTFQFGNSIDTVKQKSFNSFWELLFNPLLILGTGEKDYYSLSFLDLKLIKNDNTNKLYQKMVIQLSENSKLFRVHPTSNSVDISFFISLMSQVLVIANIRTDLISMYKNIASYRGVPIYTEFQKRLDKIIIQMSSVTNIFLEKMRDNILKEVKILIALFKAHEFMVMFNIKDSTIYLYQAKLDIIQWSRVNVRVQKEALYIWICKFHAALLSKHSLYFYHINQAFEQSIDNKKPNIVRPDFTNYYNIINKFCQTNGCYNCSIVYDVNGILDHDEHYLSQVAKLQRGENAKRETIESEVIQSQLLLPKEIKEEKNLNDLEQSHSFHFECQVGYILDLEPQQTGQGLASWPAIVSAPQVNAPKEHWPSVVSLIMDNIDFLNRYKDLIHCFDKTNNSTYYCSKLDRRMYLVLIYNKKKDQNDSTIKELVFMLSSNIRNWKVFSSLVPKIF